ncbi:sensor histidine kinase [Cellulomonas sp. PhB150]|uniref:sensor histidine kinase n=1 Tax=Cellulomonas sp. PhB150 TaxID=2485188 RepID=UPI0011CD36C3|nr:histidine kinase [Cellulomonas sp. PhB150]
MSRTDALQSSSERRDAWVPSAVMATLLGLLIFTSPIVLPDNADAASRLEAAGWWDDGSLLKLIAAVTGLSCVAAVLIARRQPVTATILALWPFVAIPLLGTFVWGWWLALLMITCLVVQDSWVRAVVPGVATLATAWLYAFSGTPAVLPIGLVNAGDWDGGRSVEAAVTYTVAVVLVVGVAVVVRLVRRSALRSVRADATERRALEVESVAVERARLARDLHDVVAHHVSLVAVRAESAPYSHPEIGDDARRVLGDIAGDARAALDELRQVLTVLQRTDGAARAPQPTACDIAELVAQAEAAGQRVTFSGDCGDVPDAQGYVLYRAAQEALTNARRHAPSALTEVVVSTVADVVGLRVTNAAEHAGEILPGRGLLGMRERVEALGGATSAGIEDGSFVLVVTLPIPADRTTSGRVDEDAADAA